MPIYEITDPKTSKVLEFEGATPPDQRTIMEAFSRASFMETKAPQKPSTIDLATQGLLMGAEGNIEDAKAAARDVGRTAWAIGKPVIEGTAIAGGAVVGTGAAGPVGGAAGAGLGYAGARRLTKGVDVALGYEQPETLTEALAATGKDVASGAAMEAGGQVLGKGIEGVVAARRYMTTKAPEKLYASATKMSTTLDPKDRAARVATGLREGITVNDKGLAKLQGLKNEMFRQIDEVIKPGAAQGKTVKTADVLSRLNAVKAKFSESATPNQYLGAIDDIANDFKTFGDEIPIDKAQRIKQNTYQILKDSAYGELKGPQKEAQKAIARGIKEELEGMFPELKGMNKKASEYIKLQDSLERAVGRIQNRDIISLGDEAMTAAGAAIGGPAGAAAVGLRKALGIPNVKARLAIALYKTGQRGLKGGGGFKGGGNIPPVIPTSTPTGVPPTTKRPISSGSREDIGGMFSPKARAILGSKISDADKERFLVKHFESTSKPLAWAEYLKGKMGPAMKEHGSHGAAVKELSKQYKAYKQNFKMKEQP